MIRLLRLIGGKYDPMMIKISGGRDRRGKVIAG